MSFLFTIAVASLVLAAPSAHASGPPGPRAALHTPAGLVRPAWPPRLRATRTFAPGELVAIAGDDAPLAVGADRAPVARADDVAAAFAR